MKPAKSQAVTKRRLHKYSEDEGTAFHESGHAVVAHLCLFEVKSVTIIPRALTAKEITLCGNGSYAAGAVRIRYGITARTKEVETRKWAKLNMDGWGMSNCAGGLAELKYSKSTTRKRGVETFGLMGDARATVTFAVAYFRGDRARATEWIGEIIKLTEALLNRPGVWNAVTAVATKVLKCGRLTGAQVRDIIACHVKPPKSIRRVPIP